MSTSDLRSEWRRVADQQGTITARAVLSLLSELDVAEVEIERLKAKNHAAGLANDPKFHAEVEAVAADSYKAIAVEWAGLADELAMRLETSHEGIIAILDGVIDLPAHDAATCRTCALLARHAEATK